MSPLRKPLYLIFGKDVFYLYLQVESFVFIYLPKVSGGIFAPDFATLEFQSCTHLGLGLGMKRSLGRKTKIVAFQRGVGNCFEVCLQIRISCPLFIWLVCPSFLQFLITSERELIWLGSGLLQYLLHLVSAPPPPFLFFIFFANAAMKGILANCILWGETSGVARPQGTETSISYCLGLGLL